MTVILAKTIDKIAGKTESVLLLGEQVPALECQQLTYVSEFSDFDFSELAQFDLVVFNNLLSKISFQQAEQLIAQARDQHAKQLMVIQSEISDWSSSDFLSLGLRLLVKSNSRENIPEVWYFSLESYKRIPDWLNNRYWANPERFDKYRW